MKPTLLAIIALAFLSGVLVSGCYREPRCEPPGEWYNGRCVFPCQGCDFDADADADADVVEAGSDATAGETGSEDSGLDAITDVGSDALNCKAGTTLCNGSCVDTNSNPAHCGGCGLACPTVLNGRATCTMGACGFTCIPGYHRCGDRCVDDTSVMSCGMSCEPCFVPDNAVRATCTEGRCGFVCRDGYMRSGDTCVPVPAPRPMAPLSTARVTSQRPRLRWALAMGTDGARVELCRDRAMTRDCQTIDALGDNVMPPSALASGVWFWRLRGRAGGSTGSATSPVWQFWVGARSAPVNTSWGTALDVNGDGYTDLAVGSPSADAGRGRVDVFYGGPGGIASTPSVTLRGIAAGELFGGSVASAGDVNGDGYADLVVGAPNADPGGRMDAGTASVYLGGPSGLSAIPHRVLEGMEAYDYLGTAVAGAGDVNGDGYADLIVGAYGADPGGRRDAGTAHVYLGGSSGLISIPHRVLEGIGAGDWFGVSVAGAGDVNGDSYADLVVGAQYADPGGRENAGTANVYLGSATGLTAVPHRVLEGTTDMDLFGTSVASAGDVNGDGYADLVVGAYLADPGGREDAGTASVYLGGPRGLTVTAYRVLEGTTAGDAFGDSVAGAGDVNGDGYADLVVGAPVILFGRRTDAGTARVYVGVPSGLTATPHRVLEGTTAGDWFGHSVASAGDVNGDGYADVVVGAYLADPGGRQDAGMARVYLGGPSGLTSAPHRTLEGAAASDRLGSSVAGAAW